MWGGIGAAAPEIIRWYRITQSETPQEWRRVSYWLATVLYIGLGAALATLIAQPNSYAAFVTGASTEFAVLGGITSIEGRPRSQAPGIERGVEEVSTRPATVRALLMLTAADHASYLRINGPG